MPSFAEHRTFNSAKLVASVQINRSTNTQMQTSSAGLKMSVATKAEVENISEPIWRPMTIAKPLKKVSDLVGDPSACSVALLSTLAVSNSACWSTSEGSTTDISRTVLGRSTCRNDSFGSLIDARRRTGWLWQAKCARLSKRASTAAVNYLTSYFYFLHSAAILKMHPHTV